MDSDSRYLIKASWISIIGNAILSLAKITIGLFSGSLAVLGDGIDSAADVIISIVMLFTAKIMNRPPNKKYVFGYNKAEAIATKILSIVIFYAGIQMLVSSVISIFSSTPKEIPSYLAVYVTVFSIIGKTLLSHYQYKQGKKHNSSLLMANAVNMRNDIMISIGVLVGLIFTFILKMPILDTITGLIISAFIIKSAISIFLESSIGLMDGVNDITVYEKIFKAVELVPGAGHPHKVRSRMIGSMHIVTLDVEVDPSLSILEGHQIAEEVENSIKNTVCNVYDVIVHIEPAGVHHCIEKFGIDEQMI